MQEKKMRLDLKLLTLSISLSQRMFLGLKKKDLSLYILSKSHIRKRLGLAINIGGATYVF